MVRYHGDQRLPLLLRFVKEKRPTISPNFNFLGQLLDFEKNIKSPDGVTGRLKPPGAGPPPDPAQAEPPLEPLTLPCFLADAPEKLAEVLGGVQLGDGSEDSTRLKRSFSLDIKSVGEPSGSSAHRAFGTHGGSGDDFYKTASFKEVSGKTRQFSPVEEVSEQSTPEQSPDKEEADGSAPPATSSAPKPPAATLSCPQHLQRSGSMEEKTTGFLLGLSHSQQQLARPGSGSALKGWHSDILLAPVTVSASSLTGGWYLSSETTRFYSSSSILSSAASSFGPLGCGHGLEAVRRRQRAGDRGDSRRSWHEESSFEKQLKRRSCQMEFGDGMTDGRSREEVRRVASQTGFSGSMEVIQVS